ncbi:hypothetical protein EJ08DRAFT_16001 [Tothia fuscella]|uniref:CCHC-type domain-containing protein n=1 Tax=Tothia fuscella TaxID=1048955 RepID=A0A9P4P2N6_9PEZI|nr:hypothetical protein EJ08DRAFT_16001 [Tothia fuscella]
MAQSTTNWHRVAEDRGFQVRALLIENGYLKQDKGDAIAAYNGAMLQIERLRAQLTEFNYEEFKKYKEQHQRLERETRTQQNTIERQAKANGEYHDNWLMEQSRRAVLEKELGAANSQIELMTSNYSVELSTGVEVLFRQRAKALESNYYELIEQEKRRVWEELEQLAASLFEQKLEERIQAELGVQTQPYISQQPQNHDHIIANWLSKNGFSHKNGQWKYEELNNCQLELSRTKVQLSTSERKLKKSLSEQAAAQEELEKMRAAEAESQKVINTTKDEKSEELKQTQGRLRQTEAAMKDKEPTIQEMQRTIDSLRSASTSVVDDKDRTIQDMQKTINELQPAANAAKAMCQKIQDLQKDKDNLENAIATKDRLNSDLQQTSDRQVQELQGKDTQISQLQNEVHGLQKASSDLQAMTKENEKMLREGQKLFKQHDDMTKLNEKMRQAGQKLEGVLDVMKKEHHVAVSTLESGGYKWQPVAGQEAGAWNKEEVQCQGCSKLENELKQLRAQKKSPQFPLPHRHGARPGPDQNRKVLGFNRSTADQRRKKIQQRAKAGRRIPHSIEDLTEEASSMGLNRADPESEDLDVDGESYEETREAWQEELCHCDEVEAIIERVEEAHKYTPIGKDILDKLDPLLPSNWPAPGDETYTCRCQALRNILNEVVIDMESAVRLASEDYWCSKCKTRGHRVPQCPKLTVCSRCDKTVPFYGHNWDTCGDIGYGGTERTSDTLPEDIVELRRIREQPTQAMKDFRESSECEACLHVGHALFDCPYQFEETSRRAKERELIKKYKNLKKQKDMAFVM